MQKKDILSLKRDPDHIEGYVTIDYKDPDTGKVKERIEGKNHVFKDTFQASNWNRLLNTPIIGVESFFITDDNSPIDDTFPFLKGNIIGWGGLEMSASGAHRGEFIQAVSWRQNITSDGTSHKQTYDFGANQIPNPIGCVGLTAQYMYSTAAESSTTFQIINDRTLTPIRGRRTVWPGTAGLNSRTMSWYTRQDNIEISLATPTVAEIGMRNTLNGSIIRIMNPSNTSALGSVIAGTGYLLSVGVDEITGRTYIYTHHNTVTNRRVYEFADDTFSVLLNTYVVNAFARTSHTQQRAFAVRNGKMYTYDNSAWYIFNFTTNSHIGTIWAGPNPCPYNNNAIGTQNFNMFSLGSDKSIIAMLAAAQGVRAIMVDTKNDRYVGSMGTMFQIARHIIFEPFLESRPLLIGQTGLPETSRVEDMKMKQAFCAFTVPDDAPERQPGQMATISYQLDVHY